MKDNRGLVLVISFVIEFIISVLTVFFLDTGSEEFFLLVIIGLVAGVIFIFLSVSEAFISKRIKVYEKLIWIVFLVFVSNLAGIAYLLIRKKRII